MERRSQYLFQIKTTHTLVVLDPLKPLFCLIFLFWTDLMLHDQCSGIGSFRMNEIPHQGSSIPAHRNFFEYSPVFSPRYNQNFFPTAYVSLLSPVIGTFPIPHGEESSQQPFRCKNAHIDPPGILGQRFIFLGL
jgi:hypothetical protein